MPMTGDREVRQDLTDRLLWVDNRDIDLLNVATPDHLPEALGAVEEEAHEEAMVEAQTEARTGDRCRGRGRAPLGGVVRAHTLLAPGLGPLRDDA